MTRVAVRLVIRGRVQGVGYRWWARGQARRLRLAGWVRNRSDGTVELVAAGSPGAVETLIEASRHGPSTAQVASVERFEADDPGLDVFEERPTV
jgi:acylphosphatase